MSSTPVQNQHFSPAEVSTMAESSSAKITAIPFNDPTKTGVVSSFAFGKPERRKILVVFALLSDWH